jgi:hypothetical protein
MIVQNKIFYTMAATFCVGSALVLFDGLQDSGTHKAIANAVDHGGIELPDMSHMKNADAGSYSIIAEKSVFVPSRKGPPPDLPANSSLVTEVPSANFSAKLIGIVAMGPMKIAIFKQEGAKESASVSEGQSIDGWTVEEINGNSVSLRAGDNKQNLRLPEAPDKRDGG